VRKQPRVRGAPLVEHDFQAAKPCGLKDGVPVLQPELDQKHVPLTPPEEALPIQAVCRCRGSCCFCFWFRFWF